VALPFPVIHGHRPPVVFHAIVDQAGRDAFVARSADCVASDRLGCRRSAHIPAILVSMYRLKGLTGLVQRSGTLRTDATGETGSRKEEPAHGIER
jgi:hypothetical protein